MTEYENDPRPDLAEDHGLWESLLAAVAEKHGGLSELYGVLHGLRCGGARLQRDPKTGLRILPGGWWRPAEYEEIKTKYLRPMSGEVKEALLEASRRIEAKRVASVTPATPAATKRVMPVPKPPEYREQRLWDEPRGLDRFHNVKNGEESA